MLIEKYVFVIQLKLNVNMKFKFFFPFCLLFRLFYLKCCIEAAVRLV